MTITHDIDPAFELMSVRAGALRPLLDMGRSARAMAIKRLSRRLQMHPSSLYRLLRRLRQGGAVEALAGGPVGFPKGRSRLTAEDEGLIERVIQEHYLTRQKPTMADTHVELSSYYPEGPGPSIKALKRRIDRIPERVCVLAREGAEAARRLKAKPGSLEIDRPNAVWQLDHTKADLMIVDVQGREIGRPWLTVSIDLGTRMISGFELGLDPPSTASTSSTLLTAIGSKKELLQGWNIDADWPIEGLPDAIHTDRGADFFRSRTFRRALQNQFTQVVFRLANRTWEGGHIERLIRTLMQACKRAPGATFSNVAERGAYDSSGQASMTLEEARRWFALQICKIYHNTRHSALGMTPLEAWRQAQLSGFEPRQPVDAERFRFDLMPWADRVISPSGVRLHNQVYFSKALVPLITTSGRRHRVRYDPRDLSTVWVEHEGAYLPAMQSRIATSGSGLWEYRAQQALARSTPRPTTSTDVFEGRLEQRRIESTAKTRKLEHRKAARAASHDAARPAKPAKPAAPDISWSPDLSKVFDTVFPGASS